MGRKSISVYLEEEHIEWIESQNLNRSEFMNELVKRHRNGQGQIEDAVREFRVEQLRSEISAKESQVQSQRRELEHLLEYEEQVEERESEYTDRISSVGDEFATSTHVFPTFRTDAKAIADDFGKQLGEVSEDIKSYVEEQGYDIEEDRWTDAYGDGMA